MEGKSISHVPDMPSLQSRTPSLSPRSPRGDNNLSPRGCPASQPTEAVSSSRRRVSPIIGIHSSPLASSATKGDQQGRNQNHAPAPTANAYLFDTNVRRSGRLRIERSDSRPHRIETGPSRTPTSSTAPGSVHLITNGPPSVNFSLRNPLGPPANQDDLGAYFDAELGPAVVLDDAHLSKYDMKVSRKTDYDLHSDNESISQTPNLDSLKKERAIEGPGWTQSDGSTTVRSDMQSARTELETARSLWSSLKSPRSEADHSVSSASMPISGKSAWRSAKPPPTTVPWIHTYMTPFESIAEEESSQAEVESWTKKSVSSTPSMPTTTQIAAVTSVPGVSMSPRAALPSLTVPLANQRFIPHERPFTLPVSSLSQVSFSATKHSASMTRMRETASKEVPKQTINSGPIPNIPFISSRPLERQMEPSLPARSPILQVSHEAASIIPLNDTIAADERSLGHVYVQPLPISRRGHNNVTRAPPPREERLTSLTRPPEGRPPELRRVKESSAYPSVNYIPRASSSHAAVAFRSATETANMQALPSLAHSADRATLNVRIASPALNPLHMQQHHIDSHQASLRKTAPSKCVPAESRFGGVSSMSTSASLPWFRGLIPASPQTAPWPTLHLDQPSASGTSPRTPKSPRARVASSSLSPRQALSKITPRAKSSEAPAAQAEVQSLNETESIKTIRLSRSSSIAAGWRPVGNKYALRRHSAAAGGVIGKGRQNTWTRLHALLCCDNVRREGCC